MKAAPRNSIRLATTAVLALTLVTLAGCDAVVFERRAPLLHTPLTVEGESVTEAIVDTGGGYEIILRESYGLKLTDTMEVLAFGGKEFVAVTEPFRYRVDGFHGDALFALVGLSVCDCNGVGFDFFRKHGLALSLDYATMETWFSTELPEDATSVTLPFADPPSGLEHFDTAFVEVTVESGGVSRTVTGLLDTGTNATIIRQGLFDPNVALAADRVDLLITRAEWGSVAVRAILFDTPGLPDLILGTDIMAAWADRWDFQFDPSGGTIHVRPHTLPNPVSPLSTR